VRVEGADGGTFLGLPVGGDLADWGQLDFFRMADGKIVERWAERDVAIFRRLAHLALPAHPAAGGATVAAERLTYPPGSSLTAPRHAGVRVVSLEAGALDVRIGGRAWLDRVPSAGDRGLWGPVPLEGVARLLPGDLLVVPADAAYAARNGGSVPAVSLDVTVQQSGLATPMTDQLGEAPGVDGVRRELLTSALATELGEASLVGVGRLILPRGGTIATHAAPGPELFVVERGSLGAARGGVEVERGPGAAELFRRGERARVRNARASPLAVVLLTITPAGQDRAAG
jgi:mannose-6-phosphate isomerase-like protein (cupin superfamily)